MNTKLERYKTVKKSLLAAAFAIALPSSAFSQEEQQTLCVEFEAGTYFCTDNVNRKNDYTSDGRRSLSNSGFVLFDDGTQIDDCKMHTLRNRQVMRNGVECRAPE